MRTVFGGFLSKKRKFEVMSFFYELSTSAGGCVSFP